MGLLRAVARTAVVAGTATAVSNNVSRRQAGRWAAQEQQQAAVQQQQQPQQQAAYQQPAADFAQQPAEPDTMDNKLTQLAQLGTLRSQGVLTDAEFEAQKAKILES